MTAAPSPKTYLAKAEAFTRDQRHAKKGRRRQKIAPIVIASALLAIYGSPMAAQQTAPLKGNELYNFCLSADMDVRASCASYLTGFADGVIVGQQLLSSKVLICPQAGITAPQLSLMLQKTAREHPEMLNQDANVIVAKALIDAFRCKLGEAPVYER